MTMACRSHIPSLYTALNYSKHLSSLSMAASSTPSSSLAATDNNLVNPPMRPTQPSSPTFLSTGNPCLDFFFHVVPYSRPETLIHRLELAWKHDPLQALKLVCNLRGVRGTGKSDEEGGYTAALWLHENHPKTLACNVDSFAGFGYFKDLLEILFRLLEGPNVRNLSMEDKIFRHHYYSRRMNTSNENESKEIDNVKRVIDRYNSDPDFKFLHDRVADYFAQCLRSDMKVLDSGGDSSKISQAAKWWPLLHSSYYRFMLLCKTIAKKVFPRDEYPEYEGVEEAHYAYFVRDRLRKQVLVPLRKALELPEVYMEAHAWGSIPYHRVASNEMLLYVDEFLESDGERFKEYIENVKTGKAEIAASTFLLHEIIGHLDSFTKDLSWKRRRKMEKENENLKTSTFHPHNRIAAARMFRPRPNKIIAAAITFLPYEIINAASKFLPPKIVAYLYGAKSYWYEKRWMLENRVDDDCGEMEKLEWKLRVGDLQLKRMVKDMAVKGKLNNCLAICHVSGGMYGNTMNVSAVLGVLVSELSKKNWKGRVITFNRKMVLQNVEGRSLVEKIKFVHTKKTYGKPNLQKVFDTLLKVAVDGKLEPNQMIKRLFVFSDMGFVQGSEKLWETDYEAIVRKFTEKGYGECVPEIVFWKLGDSEATPVQANQPGVALVSGFSNNLLTLLLEYDGIFNPEAVMEAAISGQEYQKLQVFD
ncbi:hypothetical protein CASFOL_030652 [Castilleja foliolosa]|uniref:Uncharacterized protein n=1 Tax=Castilleja foliolosa TaxID=1961234 RepID=A0ABD3C5X1_9LAMI